MELWGCSERSPKLRNTLAIAYNGHESTRAVNGVRGTDVEAPVLFYHLPHDGWHKRVGLACSAGGACEVAVRLCTLDDIAQFEVPIDSIDTDKSHVSFATILLQSNYVLVQLL